MKEMQVYDPTTIDATGIENEGTKIIKVGSIPNKTSADDEEEKQDSIPKYLAPKAIEVNRYLLKK